GALPASSLSRSCRSATLNSASAISAALRIEVPATPALPAAVSGRMSPTLTCPAPVLPVVGGAPAGGGPPKVAPRGVPLPGGNRGAAKSPAAPRPGHAHAARNNELGSPAPLDTDGIPRWQSGILSANT